jgi:hypothetical protein
MNKSILEQLQVSEIKFLISTQYKLYLTLPECGKSLHSS